MSFLWCKAVPVQSVFSGLLCIHIGNNRVQMKNREFNVISGIYVMVLQFLP